MVEVAVLPVLVSRPVSSLDRRRFCPDALLIGTNRKPAGLLSRPRARLTFQHYLRAAAKTCHNPADRLRLKFTLIDPNDHERPFCFDVFINPDEQYEVSRCIPEVPDLADLVSDLNGSNDFSAFVQTMRRSFRAFAEAGN